METAKKLKKTVLENIMAILAPIFFPVEVLPFMPYCIGITRLPLDRTMCVATWPGKKTKQGHPEIPYIGGEKYTLVENSTILTKIAEILCNKFPHLRASVVNTENEVFTVNFFSLTADKITSDFFTPMFTFKNSYNGKVKASSSAGMYRVTKDGRHLEMHLSEKAYTYKHHSDETAISFTKIIESVEAMLTDVKTIEKKIKVLKKIQVDNIAEIMTKIAPDRKTLPEKAVQIGVQNVEYQTLLLNEKPNLWILYTSLVYGIKNHEGSLETWKRTDAEGIAWQNVLNFAKIETAE